MKKLLSVLIALAMFVTLTACGSSNSGNEEGNETKTFKIGMVTDTGGINDQSFNQSSWDGLQRAKNELGVEVAYLESKTDADYSANIQTFVDEEYDLIICVGFMLAEATRQAAEANPNQKFAIIDDDTCADLPNVAPLMFDQQVGSYLVGYLAGLTTKTNTVGFVLGMAFPNMHRFGYGYLAGVLAANPDAKVLQFNANSFGDAAIGKTATKDMITNGADVVYHAAGGTGAGVIEACAEEKIWAIGVDSDQAHLAPEYVLSSAMKRVDVACYDIISDVVNGKYNAGVHNYGLSNGGVGIAPTTTNIPADVLAKVQEAEAKVKSGELKVPNTIDEFEAMFGKDVYTLD